MPITPSHPGIQFKELPAWLRDPYDGLRFLVYWPGSRTPVAGVSKVRGLRRSAEGTCYGALALERGVARDVDFARFASRMDDARRDLVIEAAPEFGGPRLRYKVFRSWVTRFQASPSLDPGTLGIARLELENDGWERA
jgi:hypothetical protein